MLKLRHEADDSPDHFQAPAKSASARSTRPAGTPAAIRGSGASTVCRTALARSMASSERSRMPRPNLPPPGRVAQDRRVARRRPHSADWRAAVAFTILVLNPFVMDYLCVARGYSISLAAHMFTLVVIASDITDCA
jgi:hypothetical protein